MAKSRKVYTYRCGKKINLEKSPDQMVVRALPEDLDDAAIIKSEQVSSASSRLTTNPDELESMMARSRQSAPTHHAYYDVESGQELLLSDRIIVTFHDELADEQMDDFTTRYALILKTKYSNRDYLFQLTNHTGMNPVKLVVKLMEEEELVANAELDLNQRMHVYNVPTPTDPEYVQQWHLHTNFNDDDYDPRSSSLCQEAWNLLGHYGNDNVVVAVSDDGCKLDHIDFDSDIKFSDWGYMRESGSRSFESLAARGRNAL